MDIIQECIVLNLIKKTQIYVLPEDGIKISLFGTSEILQQENR